MALEVAPGHLEFIRSRVADGEAGGRGWDAETGEFFGYDSSYPEWFRNKDYRRAEVLRIIDKYLGGGSLTPRQQDIFEDLVTSSMDEYETCCKRDKERDMPPTCDETAVSEVNDHLFADFWDMEPAPVLRSLKGFMSGLVKTFLRHPPAGTPRYGTGWRSPPGPVDRNYAVLDGRY
ncbi:MAG: hypothetical protein ACYC69_02570 [Thermodesulfovibrionales bacterium]